jgi:hypothetical protein
MFGYSRTFDPSLFQHSDFDHLPVNTLVACLTAVRDLSDTNTQPAMSLQPRSFPDPLPATSRSWIPAIYRFLPHTWIDMAVTASKALKHDDAAPPSHLWDQRLVLLYPKCLPVLDWIRSKLLCMFRHRLLREVCGYLHHRFGNT